MPFNRSDKTINTVPRILQMQSNRFIYKKDEFPAEVCEKLGCYVYIYSCPETMEPFYIGKGRDNRCFHHLYENSKSSKNKSYLIY